MAIKLSLLFLSMLVIIIVEVPGLLKKGLLRELAVFFLILALGCLLAVMGIMGITFT